MILTLSMFVLILAIYLAIISYNVKGSSYYLVGFFILFSTYSLSHYLIVDTKSVFWIAVFYNHLSPFWLLPGPFLYFYVKGTVTDKNPLNNKIVYLNFIPAIIQLIGIVPYCLKPFSEKEEIAKQIISNVNNIKYIDANWLYPKSFIGFLIRPALTTFYALYSAVYLIKNRPSKNENKKFVSKQYVITYYWLIFFITITIIIGVSVFFSLYYLTFFNNPEEIREKLPSPLLSGMGSFLLIVCLLTFPNILYGIPRIEENNIKPANESSNDPLIQLGEKIIDYINTHKSYLDKDFNINDLALSLQIPQHHIIYYFSNIIQLDFAQYVTICRINYAKELIDKGIYHTLTMEEIALQSGFSSKTNFYKAFKKETGSLPTEYSQ